MDNNSNMLQLCRLCLVKDDVNIPIFEEQGDIRQIFLKISSCLPVKVSRDDRLPKKICDGCSYKLDMLYEFWNTSANAEKQLLTWLGEAGMTSQMADGTISAVAQQIKPADDFVKQEAIDPPDIQSDDDDKDYVFPEKEDEKSRNNVDEPPPKRARRTAAVKAAIAMDQDSDDDDSGEPMTKIEDDSEDSDNDDHEPAFVDVPSTSADDQPGPSGVGKDGVEAPCVSTIVGTNGQLLKKVTFMCRHCKVVYNTPLHLSSHLKRVIPRITYHCSKCKQMFSTIHECSVTTIKCAYCLVNLEENSIRAHFCFHLISEEISFKDDDTLKCKICQNDFNMDQLVPHMSKCYNLCHNEVINIESDEENEVESHFEQPYLSSVIVVPPTVCPVLKIDSEVVKKTRFKNIKLNNKRKIVKNVYTKTPSNSKVAVTTEPIFNENRNEKIIEDNIAETIRHNNFAEILETVGDTENISKIIEHDEDNISKSSLTNTNTDLEINENIDLEINKNIDLETSQNTDLQIKSTGKVDKKLIKEKIRDGIIMRVIRRIDRHKHICFYCRQHFNDTDIIEHMEICSLVSCIYCYKKFSNKDELQQHMESIEPSVTSFCMHCVSPCNKDHEEQENKHHIKSFCTMCHSLVYENMKNHKCFHVFSHEEMLNYNTKLHQESLYFTCVHCNKKVPYEFLKTHVINLHSTLLKTFNCNFCQATFDNRILLKKHEKAHRTFLCHICGKTNMKYASDHVKSHLDKEQHKCKYCKRGFALLQHLQRHMLVHLEKGKHVCNTCKKCFKTRYNLRVHQRIHEAIKPFKCPICLKTYQTKQARNNHMKTHRA